MVITVEDDGRGMIADAVQKSGGHGLTGMRERVGALGGELTTGTRAGGGFRVHATLPTSDDQVSGRPQPGRTPAHKEGEAS